MRNSRPEYAVCTQVATTSTTASAKSARGATSTPRTDRRADQHAEGELEVQRAAEHAHPGVRRGPEGVHQRHEREPEREVRRHEPHSQAQRQREHGVEDQLVGERPADHQQRLAALRQGEERGQDARRRAAVRADRGRHHQVDDQDERADDPVGRVDAGRAPRQETPRGARHGEQVRRRRDHHRAADDEEQVDAVGAQDVERRRPGPAREVGRFHRVGVDDHDQQRRDRAQRLHVTEHPAGFDATPGAPASSQE